MKYLAALLVVAVLVAAEHHGDHNKDDDDHHGRGHHGRGHHSRDHHDSRHAGEQRIHEYRVVNQNLHIDMLEKEVDSLEELLDDLTPLPEEHEVEKIKARVRRLEDDQCEEESEVQCGGDVPQCISHLFVCDGHEDCDNGRDEDDYVCSDEPYKVGSTVSGITSWHDCITHDPHMTVITITANVQPEGFTSRTYLRGVISFEVDEVSHLVETYNARGYWNPAKRALVLVPEKREDSAGFGIVCKFNMGNHDEADCKIGTIASRHECATLHVSRA